MLIRELELTPAIERRMRRVANLYIIMHTRYDGEPQVHLLRRDVDQQCGCTIGYSEPRPEERRRLQRIARLAGGFAA